MSDEIIIEAPETKLVVDANLSVFLVQFQKVVQDGFVLAGEEDNPQCGQYGYLYEANMVKAEGNAPAKRPGRPKGS